MSEKVDGIVQEVRAIKKARRLRAADIASAGGLSVRTVQGFLMGRHGMPLEKLERLLDELGYRLTIEPKQAGHDEPL